MRIYTEVIFEWDDKQGKLVETSSESFDYQGEMALAGANWYQTDLGYDEEGNKWHVRASKSRYEVYLNDEHIIGYNVNYSDDEVGAMRAGVADASKRIFGDADFIANNPGEKMWETKETLAAHLSVKFDAEYAHKITNLLYAEETGWTEGDWVDTNLLTDNPHTKGTEDWYEYEKVNNPEFDESLYEQLEDGTYQLILEDTFGNVGVLQQCSVTRTPHGVVWANSSGCYLYDGSKLVNLIDDKIPVTSDYASIGSNFWLPSVGTDRVAAVAYIRNRDSILVKFALENFSGVTVPDGAVYHFPTKSWAFTQRAITSTSLKATTDSDFSNFITNVDGDVLYFNYRNENNQWEEMYTNHPEWISPAEWYGSKSSGTIRFTNEEDKISLEEQMANEMKVFN